jgi:hypothetical protein
MLADQGDKNSRTDMPVYDTPAPRHHVVQQQQQLQPDADEEAT